MANTQLLRDLEEFNSCSEFPNKWGDSLTIKEIKNINREISRLRAKLVRISAEADSTSQKLSDLPSRGQATDKVGDAVAQIADLKADIEQLEIRRNSALNSLTRDDFVENCIYMRLALNYSWGMILRQAGGSNTIDSLKKMCYRHKW